MDGAPLVVVPLVLGLAGAALALGAAPSRPAWPPWIAAGAATAAFAATLLAWARGAPPLDVAWAPTLGIRLHLALDGLAAPWALLATGIGALVALYAARYLPRFNEHHHRPPGDAGRFFALLLLFMVAMVGLATAQDLVLLFVFWDLTAVASWGLIGYDRASVEARRAALMALLVTGVTSIGVMIAALLLHAETGSFSLPAVLAEARPGGRVRAAAALLAVAALAKSAQMPLHFWLPRAMAAPTPVSAYLHSAAMVAAGVFLLARVHPLLALAPGLLEALVAVGLVSIILGSVLALTRDRLKQVLAYSTIAQYGYVTLLLGLGGDKGAAGAVVYVIGHALAKSALFMTAGAVTEATGEDRLSGLGGLARRLPVLAGASAVAAATLAGLPLTVGYFKDEAFFAAALTRGWPLGLAAAACAALTLAYTWRLWRGMFLGPSRGAAHPIPALLVVPVAALAALALAGGIRPAPVARLAEAAARAILGTPAPVELAYHLARPESGLALAAWAGGALLIWLETRWRPAAKALATLGTRVGPLRWYGGSLRTLNLFSRRLLGWELRDLRSRITPIMVPSAALVGLGLVATRGVPFDTGPVTAPDVPLALALLLAAGAALGATAPRRHLALALALSATGFSLAGAYAFFGAPDVALVAVLVETMLALLLVALLSRFPRAALARQARRPDGAWRLRNPLLALLAAGFAFVVGWSVLSRPAGDATMARALLARTPDAHGADAVTVILADFRGLDTVGEITVIGTVLVGITVLLGRRRP